MTDRPILFSGPMIRALLDGRKTQTRRVLKLPEQKTLRGEWEATTAGGPGVTLKDGTPYPERAAIWHTQTGCCVTPGYVHGDQLWVRERFAVSGIGWGKKPSEARGGKVHFHADPEHGWHDYWGSWRPSIHMPRWASRLTLTVTDVRVQRLQEISEDDARAEGVERRAFTKLDGTDPQEWWVGHENGRATAKSAFRDLWDSLNADRAPWASNPWVCAVSFTVHQGNIDQAGLAA